jgi:hypothetical protein
MARGIDFILPSCPGIPDFMWIAISGLIDTLIKRCQLFFGIFLPLKLMVDAVADAPDGKFDLRACVRTLFQAILIGIFLFRYKFILMFFDNFIDTLSGFDKEAFSAALVQAHKKTPDSLFREQELVLRH